MSDIVGTILEVLNSSEPIQREQVRKWISSAVDMEDVAVLYRLSQDAWERITPKLDRDETCRLICRYFLFCIAEDPPEGIAQGRYEAAGDLESWIDHLSAMEDTQENLKDVAGAITKLYLESNQDVRMAIETGFLEHVLEQARLRPLFAHWADDEELKVAWGPALAWGEADPNYMKGIRDKLRAPQSKQRENPSEN